MGSNRRNLLTVMVAPFGLLANGPALVADPSRHWDWTESILNLALTGAAWVFADSLGQPGLTTGVRGRHP